MYGINGILRDSFKTFGTEQVGFVAGKVCPAGLDSYCQ
jgi:hypothetical protein